MIDIMTAGIIQHRPLGFEAPYTSGPDERTPRLPEEGQIVTLGVMTPVPAGIEQLICRWRLNGVPQTDLLMQKTGLAPRQVSPFLAVSPLNEVESSLAGSSTPVAAAIATEPPAHVCWKIALGPFAYGDRIDYGFTAGHEIRPEEDLEFSFEVRAWRPLNLVADTSGGYFLAFGGQPLAALNLEAKQALTFRLRLQGFNQQPQTVLPAEFDELKAGGPQGAIVIEVDRPGQPGRLRLKGLDGLPLLASAAPLFYGRVTAQGKLEAVRLQFSDGGTDFYGLGERFDRLNQRGLDPDIRVYEEYKNQGNRTYFPIPFGFSPEGYGLYLDCTTYSRFSLPASGPATCEVELPPDSLDIYFFVGAPRQILDAFTRLTGRPVLPPDWIYTPWISGNEWNSQVRTMQEVERGEQLGIPAGVIVIEAWADETTFYVFNDAAYSPRPADRPPRYSDFRFPPDGHWPDPRGMIEELHRRGYKVLLWQIPVLKSFEEVEQSMAERAAAGQRPQLDSLEQHRRDTAYALEHGYCVLNADGTPYRNPGIWFNGAYVLDITNPAARQWWMSRRAYLVQELGIDGFKTDGGEHLWGSDLRFFDGRRGAEMINAYPRLYSQMYFDALQAWGQPGITFSRAGFSGSQKAPCHWAGDENSTFEAFRHSVVAGLSAGLSGIPFWGWDIGGFSGPLPTSELFLRATAMAVFCPIMQYHSEYNAHRRPLRDRTPWNIAESNNTPWLLDAYTRLARLRMQLIPYIQQAARQSVATGEPLMRALVLDWPDDPACRSIEDQYTFGPDYLVAPVLEEGRSGRDVYLPAGQWQDFWDGPDAPVLAGGQWLLDYPAKLLEKPALVFIKL